MIRHSFSGLFFFFVAMFLASPPGVSGQVPATGKDAADGHKLLRKADRLYKSGRFDEAEDTYRKAQDIDPTPQGAYNLGNSIYRQERFDEAIGHYKGVTESATDPATKANAWYNLGNAYFNNKDFKNSVEAYKQALRINPNDLATKENLALAQQLLKLQQQQQQQRNQQQYQDQQNEDQQQQQDQDQDQQNQDQQKQQQPRQSPPKKKPQKEKLSKEEMEQLLRIMEQEEQKVQRKLRRAKATKPASGRNW